MVLSKPFSVALLSTIALAALPSCSTDAGGTESSSSSGSAQPWTEQFIMGNSALNTASIVTYEDGKSKDYLADYVLESALPSANLEVFTTHAYLPWSASSDMSVSDVRVVVSRVDGTDTGDIAQNDSGEYVERTTIDGTTYSVYRLTGFYANDPPVAPSDFANVTFQMKVTYEKDGAVADTSQKTIEIYKR